MAVVCLENSYSNFKEVLIMKKKKGMALSCDSCPATPIDLNCESSGFYIVGASYDEILHRALSQAIHISLSPLEIKKLKDHLDLERLSSLTHRIEVLAKIEELAICVTNSFNQEFEKPLSPKNFGLKKLKSRGFKK